MHPLLDRIMADEHGVCPAEINRYNASRIYAWIEDTNSHHTKEECHNGKNCVHAPGEHTVLWAEALLTEAPSICTCGRHKES